MKKRKNMLQKDFFMEIKKSWGRFISIFFIVALGVAFYAGIRSSEPSMRISGDAYFDSEHLMDIKVMGTMGLTDDDIEEIEKVEGVESAEGGYSTDVLCSVGDTEKVVHVMSMQKNFNDVQVAEGRLPKKENECLLDEDFAISEGYEVGDTITVSSGSDEALSDTLTTDTYKIVGIGNSPLYISFGRGSSTVGNGEISGFIVVTEDAFCTEVYSEAYVRVEGAADEIAFTDNYEDIVSETVDRLEEIADARCEVRRQNIMDEAYEEVEDAQQTVDEETKTLADARQELEDSKSTAARELADAKKQLEDARQLLERSKQQIADGEVQLESGKQELISQQGELDAGKQEYESGITQLEQKEKELQSKKEAYLVEYNQQMPLITGGKQEISKQKEELQEKKEELDEGKSKVNESLKPLQELQNSFNDLQTHIDQLTIKIEDGETYYQMILETPEGDRTQEQEEFLEKWPSMKSELEQSLSEVTQNKESLIAQMQEQGIESEEVLGQMITALESQLSDLEQLEQELTTGEQKLLEKEQELEAAEQALIEAGNQLESGEAQLAQARKTLELSKKQIDAGQTQIDAAWKMMDGQEQTLAEGKAELEKGTQELKSNWSEYEQAAAEAAKQIADGEAKIKDGERQLEEAKQEITDAKAEIQKIENPEWYVQDRSSALAEYDGYGDNADRMRAIGQVFPAVFFLVAALISLTAMTRMVEEQRIQIGTLKALGYSKFAIAGKYITYALTATLGGSIVGVLFGEKVFPWIIIYAYKIMYQHIPHILVPYHLSYALQATLIAVLCTLVATLMACYKELASVPAELMRPPAPKQGQRILLERVGFIWRHLNFTWKSSIRNLVRYKKRFFMTVFGIGGCMALMVVGFGLKDSIFEIPTLQYEEIQHYDAAVYYDDDLSPGEKEEIVKGVKDETAVDQEIQVRMQNLEVQSDSETLDVYLTVPESTDHIEDFLTFRSRTSSESYTLEGEGAILTEKAAEALDVEVGDSVKLEDNDLGEKEVTVKAICENYMGHYIYLSPDYYEELFGVQAKYNGILVKLQDGKEDQMEKIGSHLLKNENVLNISYTTSIEDQLDDMLRSLNLVIVVLIISAGMLAFVVLYNLNTINITERKRELATIKVLGFYDMEVASYVYRENILLTLIGSLVGMGLGRLLLQFVIVTVEVDEIMFGRVIHFPSYMYSFLFTLGFSMFVNWVMYFKLKRIDMVESLKSVE